VEIPARCPVCGGETQIKQVSDVKSLYCINEECPAKKIKAFTLFVSRNAMNMEGLSEATLEKFIELGYLHEFADLFRLDRYKEQIVSLEGFGEKSYQNLIESVEQARNTTLPRLIYALGIGGIGVANAKMLSKHFHHDFDAMRRADVLELSAIEGVGEVIANTFVEYMQQPANQAIMDHLLEEINIEIPVVEEGSQTLDGMNFVITGSLVHFENRDQLKEQIEQKGGKVTGSVTSKTTCLINNDVTSSSSKNKKAKELGVPILSEEEFLEKFMN
jgi:DNA ligase (NAD+)